jgi:hypothetical protein
MAKGQKRSNRETRKPKQTKPKPAASSHAFPHSLLSSLDRPVGASPAGPKGPRR